MSKGTNQKLKLSYLTRIMLEKTDEEHELTMPQIMEELARYDITAERKSIYSDFADMTDKLGIEIIKIQRGRETFYHVGERQFELAEVKLLIDAIQSSKFITEKKSQELIAKVKSFVSKYQASQIQRQVYVHGRIKTMNESIYYVVDAIHTAIAQNKQISFKYCTWSVDKKLVPKKDGELYVVSPWAMTWDDENYYMVGYDAAAGKVKHYRVDKMMKLDILDEMREGEGHFANFNMASYAKQNFGMYGGEVKRVRIEFSKEDCGLFIDRFGKDIEFIPVEDDRLQISVNVAISRHFFGWIFSLGPDVKIVGPDDVVDEIKHASAMFALQYR